MITILRNNQAYGPYSIDNVKLYVEEGKILMTDKAQDPQYPALQSVREILNQYQIQVHIKHNGSLVSQIRSIGKTLIFPKFDFIKNDLFKDQKLIYLASVGLAPAFLIRFTFSSYLTFYAIALYFSVIWGIFFYYLFKTNQVATKTTMIIFFLSQASALTLININLIPPFSLFYSFLESNSFVLKLLGYVLGVGVLEEFIKAVPLFYLIRKTKEPIIPQTLVFYGLMSGIGFGVFEGVLYQTSSNTHLEYNEAFFMNIARLTSLPFLHAVWSGIAGYFIAFGNLYPLNRRGLVFLSIAIPALLHGTYDVFGWSIIGLVITVISVLLLIYYLKKSTDYQSKFISI